MQKVELPATAHSGRRLAAAVILLVVGVVALAYAFTGLFAAKKGWQEIEADTKNGEIGCGGDFVLLYELGASGESVSAEKRGLTAVYTDATVQAARLFDSALSYEGVHNIWYINRHPNEAVDVDPALYQALEQVAASGDRSLYLGPVYEIYNGLFSCADDAQTADFDPRQNASLREYFARCAAYGADPSSVDLELLGDGKVKLVVSEEYLAFAREQEIERFIDLYWMKNAFIADYLAQTLIENGYTRGALSSYDGFMCNLGGGEESFAIDVYDRAVPAGSMTYAGQMSLVYLRGYPGNGMDGRRFYEMADNTVLSAYLDPADGLCKTAWDDLLAYARGGSCGRTVLALAPLFVAERPDTGGLEALAREGIFTVRCENGQVRCTDPDLPVTAEEGYTAVFSGE